jgi:cytoskeletal protein RodZ
VLSNIDNSSEPEIIATTSATPSKSTAQSVTPSASASPRKTDAYTVTGSSGVNVEIMANSGNTWLYATNEEGKVLYSGLIRKGLNQNFIQPKQVNLRVGNAGAVQISVNGINVGPIGANGEVVNLTYNAD